MRLDQHGLSGSWQGNTAGASERSAQSDGESAHGGGDFMVVLLCVGILAGMGYILYRVSPDGLGFGLFGKVDAIETPNLQAITPALSRVLSTSAEATTANPNAGVPTRLLERDGVMISMPVRVTSANAAGVDPSRLSIAPAVKKQQPPAAIAVRQNPPATVGSVENPPAQKNSPPIAKAPTTRPVRRALAKKPTGPAAAKPATSPVAAKPPSRPLAKRSVTPVATPVATPGPAKPVAAGTKATPDGRSGSMAVVTPEQMKQMLSKRPAATPSVVTSAGTSKAVPASALTPAPVKRNAPVAPLVVAKAMKSGSI